MLASHVAGCKQFSLADLVAKAAATEAALLNTQSAALKSALPALHESRRAICVDRLGRNAAARTLLPAY